MRRVRCVGAEPLTGRLEPWQEALCDAPELLAGWLAEHGSPLNVLDPGPLGRNADELLRAAAAHGVELAVYLARKANKALTFVDEARRLGLGIDVASRRELEQVLERGVPASAVVVTAAVKPRALLELAVASGATLVLDNEDELTLLAQIARGSTHTTPVAFRLAPLLAGRTPSRFGLAPDEILRLVERADWPLQALALDGVHFHLDGYAANERVIALEQSIELVDALRARGHRPTFIDMGGGIPMSYLDDAGEWHRFWREHRSAVLGERAPLTFDGHGLGLVAHAGELVGRPNAYPYHQTPTRGAWLEQVLGSRGIAHELTRRGLVLRCEPGRALLDGCGLTAARVEFRKQRRDGTWLVGVAMNRTQCRSTSDDYLVDPLLLRPDVPPGRPTGAIEGYLVGAYCIERELLTWRRMCFPDGVEVGDILVFPNTAGYLMHILESASHQIPLARNVVRGPGDVATLDAIDLTGSRPAPRRSAR